jgi:asparagine synthase (glutamine-hydrolysing)
MDVAILPDNEDAAALARRIPGTCRIDHASGRPWLVGTWADDRMTLVTAGSRRLAVLGRTRLDEDSTVRALARVHSLHDLDAVASRLPGQFHLAASVDGDTRVQGSVSTSHHIFSTVVAGVSVAASSPRPLLRLTEPAADDAMLAARLLVPGGPTWPLSQRSFWRGIQSLTAGHWLRLGSDGRSGAVRWWHLPQASLPSATAATALQAALVDAVALRCGGTVSADLSGGLDSNCLCFLAALAGADLVTYHTAPLNEANEDTVWAERAAAYLTSARHRWLPAQRPENFFDARYRNGRLTANPEGPPMWASGVDYIRDLMQRVSAEGSSVHLAGIGGDELFGNLPAYPWSLFKAHPVRSLPWINRYRQANRFPLGATLRALTDHSSFAASLAAASDRITDLPGVATDLDLSWIPTPRMPPWATEDATEAVRRLLREAAAENPEPLDGDRLRHQALESLLFEGKTARHVNLTIAGTGVSWEAPYLDDRVIEAALSVRVRDRLAPGRFKPLLVEAMRGIVPADVLARRSKGEYSAEIYEGLRRNQHRLLELCDDSRLAARGLIDPDAFRSALLNPGPLSQHVTPFDSTVAVEGWLRAQEAAAEPVGGPR